MSDAFYISATALEAHQSALDMVSNNIANVNSTAFKRGSVHFAELVTAPEQSGPVDRRDGISQASMALGGVEARTDGISFDQGQLTATNQTMDVAINGDGFFEVLGPAGQTMLWRGGTLQVNGDGYLAAGNGMALRQLISVPADASQLTIGSDGTVSALTGGGTTPTRLGQIGLAQVRDLSSIRSAGGGLYVEPNNAHLEASTAGQDGAGLIVQGSIEISNVNLTNEMTNLLLIQRVYGANAQVLQAADELLNIANGLRRG